jgi:hypothetical protein
MCRPCLEMARDAPMLERLIAFATRIRTDCYIKDSGSDAARAAEERKRRRHEF